MTGSPRLARTSALPALAAYLAALLLTALASRAMLPAAGLMATPVVNGCVMAGVAVVTARALGPGVKSRLGLGASRAGASGTLAATAGMLGLSLALGALVDALGPGSGGTMASLAEALRAPSPGRFALAIVSIGVVPGVAEELLFRGLILGRLTASWGRWPAIATSAATFGLIHGDAVQAAAAFVAGVYLAWLADLLGGIRPAMAAHGINNGAFVAVSAAGWGGSCGRGCEIATGAAGAAVCALAVVHLRASRRAS